MALILCLCIYGSLFMSLYLCLFMYVSVFMSLYLYYVYMYHYKWIVYYDRALHGALSMRFCWGCILKPYPNDQYSWLQIPNIKKVSGVDIQAHPLTLVCPSIHMQHTQHTHTNMYTRTHSHTLTRSHIFVRTRNTTTRTHITGHALVASSSNKFPTWPKRHRINPFEIRVMVRGVFDRRQATHTPGQVCLRHAQLDRLALIPLHTRIIIIQLYLLLLLLPPPLAPNATVLLEELVFFCRVLHFQFFNLSLQKRNLLNDTTRVFTLQSRQSRYSQLYAGTSLHQNWSTRICDRVCVCM